MLTAAQIKARAGKLTASRVACLMRGDRAEIYQLYLELTGQAAEEDLSAIWPVQLGAVTEQLNLDWYERKNGAVTRRGEVVAHPRHDWGVATLDGFDPRLGCPIECKHVGGREPIEVVIDRYQPQMHWQMACTDADQCALSIIVGADAPVVEYVTRDQTYAAEMIERGVQFIASVAARRVPVQLDLIPPPVDATKLIDMTGNNTWANAAAAWLAHKVGHDACRDAEKTLKSIVPEEAKKCFAYGVQITRDRAGRLSLRRVSEGYVL